MKQIEPSPHACFPEIWRLEQGQPIDETPIYGILAYVDARRDCADFRLLCLLRSLFAYRDLISDETLAAMERTILGFKYGMDEPGEDSMCYWSENHQILFAVCAYLAGQLFPTQIFTNSGLPGLSLQAQAKRRLERWLDLRWRFGFVEWHSNVYYEEDVSALSLLADFGEDSLLVKRAHTLLDLLMLDMAMHHYRGYLCATSGRCYEAEKKDVTRQHVSNILQKAFGFHASRPYDYTTVSADFVLNRSYRVPAWIRAIAHDEALGTVRCTMGLDLREIDEVFPDPSDIDGRAMYLWSMEAFTNPEACETAVRLYHAWDLKHNGFLKDLKALDLPVVRPLGLLPLVMRILKPVTSGIAIQKVDSLSHRTPYGMMSSAQRYYPGTFGDQHHIWQATVGEGVSVFTTHPGSGFSDSNARNRTPNAWVGNGILPDCRQAERVLVCVYDLSPRKGFMEKERANFSHAFFPQAAWDEWSQVSPTTLVARSGDAYLALVGLEPLEREDDEAFRQIGRRTAWICIIGDAPSDGSYANFVQRCSSVLLTRRRNSYRWSWDGVEYVLQYRGDFTVDGVRQPLSFPRLSSKYGVVPRDPDVFKLEVNGVSVEIS